MSSPSNSAFVLRDKAREQIQNAAVYLGRNNRQKAVKWLADVKATIDELAEHPDLGVSFPVKHPALHSIRRYRVRNHRRYWIYYRPFASRNGIEVFGLLHESQDISTQLESTI